ncbi:MAG: hypothetical protein QW727_01990 [Candidatus Pacearchaeota archaeon]
MPGIDYEYRWFFPLIIAMLAFTGKGAIFFSDYVSKLFNNKKINIFIILIILGLGIYTQIVHVDGLIKIKKDSYLPVKDAALWMKENSNKWDVMLSVSYTQTAHYSERKVYTFAGMNESSFEELLNKAKPKYMMVSIFEPNHPEWSYNIPKKYRESIMPVKVWFADAEQKQPILIVYEFLYNPSK